MVLNKFLHSIIPSTGELQRAVSLVEKVANIECPLKKEILDLNDKKVELISLDIPTVIKLLQPRTHLQVSYYGPTQYSPGWKLESHLLSPKPNTARRPTPHTCLLVGTRTYGNSYQLQYSSLRLLRITNTSNCYSKRTIT